MFASNNPKKVILIIGVDLIYKCTFYNCNELTSLKMGNTTTWFSVDIEVNNIVFENLQALIDNLRLQI